jgi:hypothetical protein
LIGYLDQTNDHRFEPWVGQDPSYSEDPMSVLGPPMSPLGLFPGMWQRHHAVDVVSQDTLKKLEAKVAPPRPPGKTVARKGKTLPAAGPWGNRRNVEETYRELFDAPPEATREEDGPPSAAGGLRKLLNPEDDDSDDD